MANPVRGEHTFTVKDVGSITLRLNMGALAEIEAEMGCSNVGQLVQRMINMGIRDVMVILLALARAGGHKELTLKEIEDWPPTFNEYSKAIHQTLILGGFINDPKKEIKPDPKGKSQ